MKLILGYRTRAGVVFVGQTPDGYFHPVWKGEALGAYKSIAGAVEDVAHGAVFTPSDGTRMGSLDIPDDWGEWEPAREFL